MFEFQFKQEKNLSAGISDKLIKQRSPPTSPASRWRFHSGKPPPRPHLVVFSGKLKMGAGLIFTPVLRWERDGAATGSSNGGIKEEQSVP